MATPGDHLRKKWRGWMRTFCKNRYLWREIIWEKYLPVSVDECKTEEPNSSIFRTQTKTERVKMMPEWQKERLNLSIWEIWKRKVGVGEGQVLRNDRNRQVRTIQLERPLIWSEAYISWSCLIGSLCEKSARLLAWELLVVLERRMPAEGSKQKFGGVGGSAVRS